MGNIDWASFGIWVFAVTMFSVAMGAGARLLRTSYILFDELLRINREQLDQMAAIREYFAPESRPEPVYDGSPDTTDEDDEDFEEPDFLKCTECGHVESEEEYVENSECPSCGEGHMVPEPEDDGDIA